MREITTQNIIQTVKQLAISAARDLGDDVVDALKGALAKEDSPVGREILQNIIDNAEIAHTEQMPLCQDTGTAVVFVELGQEVHITGGSLRDAIHEGVRQGYNEGLLRKSILEPLGGPNTGDNTPAVIHYDVVPGDTLKIMVVPKGGGAENMSRVTCLVPSDGIKGIKEFIVNRVRESGGKPCPPLVVGVGIGGTFERAALLAKRSLIRNLGTANPDPKLDRLEKELLEEINALGIGPQGLGGRTTALEVHVIAEPHHIASIPVAVNIQCHSNRHKGAVL